MEKPNTQRLKRPAGFVDRIEIWFSTHKYIDGLWIGTWEDNADSVLPRVEEALGVIKIYDRLRYDRITRDLERVWVRALFGNDAEYNHAMKACELDVRFVRAATSSPAIIASIIVHEATHARILNRRIPYEVALRNRVEAVCVRRELAFAKRLPNGLNAQERAERLLEMSATPELWTDEKFRERHAEGVMGVARHVGVPIWIAHFALCFRDLHTAAKHRLRRLLKAKEP
jgi:hypothetical protein